jgi:hypothetical protein
MRIVAIAFALTLNTAAHAQSLTNIGTEPCGLFAMYLQYPEAMKPELWVYLDGIRDGLDATGWPRGSLETDYLRVCAEGENLTIREAISATFDIYQAALSTAP